jgi:choline dehydrogenase
VPSLGHDPTLAGARRSRAGGQARPTTMFGVACGVQVDRASVDMQWQALGNQGWGYADVLPYFKKIESYSGGDSEYRGRGGPLNITDLPTINPLTAAFVEAGAALGYPHNDDYNGASQDGFGTFQLTIDQGKRQSAAVAYLHPVQSRPNLTVWTQTLVTRVLSKGRMRSGSRI